MKICLFVYDFPHIKSIDFMLYLATKAYNVELIVGAPWTKLKTNKKSVRTKVRSSSCIEPSELAKVLGLNYVTIKHDDVRLTSIINEHSCDIGVIAGARILKPFVINCFEYGIVNFHPGRLPEIRGLDAVLWSIKKNIPFSVTSHIIDSRIDAGNVLEIVEATIQSDDTVYDISEKMRLLQIDMIESTLKKAFESEYMPIDFRDKVNPALTYDESLKILNS